MLKNKQIDSAIKNLRDNHSEKVREAITEVNNDIDALVKHPDPDIRVALAWEGFALDVLGQDEDPRVREVVKQKLENQNKEQ